MNQLTRRSVTTGLAAVTAIPAVGLCKDAEGPSEFAAMVRRYYAEVDVFNRTEHETDDEANADSEATWRTTFRGLRGVPVRTAEDALAAVDLIIREGEGCMISLNSEYADEATLAFVVNSLRAYLAGRVVA